MVARHGGRRAALLGVPGVAPGNGLLQVVQAPYIGSGYLPEAAVEPCKELRHVHAIYGSTHDSY